jgi:hypothetical protein
MNMKLSTIKKFAAGHLVAWVAEIAIRFFPKSNRLSRFHDRLVVMSEVDI